MLTYMYEITMRIKATSASNSAKKRFRCNSRLYIELSPRSVSQVDDAENVLAEFVEFLATVVASGLESRELILERHTNKKMRNL